MKLRIINLHAHTLIKSSKSLLDMEGYIDMMFQWFISTIQKQIKDYIGDILNKSKMLVF